MTFPGPTFTRALLAVLVCTMLQATEPPSPEAASRRPWRVGVEAEASPFTFADHDGRPAGFAVELLRAVAAARGLELEYHVLPWADALAQFRSGRLDIICNIVDTPERKKFIAFSSTTAHLHGALFLRRDRAPIKSYGDINGLRVAMPRDSRAHEFVKRNDWQVDHVFVPSLTECLRAVHEGRADAVFSTDLVARDVMRRLRYTDIVRVDLPFAALDYREHFGVTPGNTDLLAELNEGLLAVQRSGHYDRLYERWVGPLQPRTLGWRDLRPYAPPLVGILVLILFAFAWQRRMLLRLARQAQALRQSEERLSLVFEGSQDGFWDWDPRTDAILRSPRWYSMLGYTPADGPTTREAFLGLIRPDDRENVLANERELWGHRDHFSIEMRVRAKDGTWKWILDRGKVVSRDPQTGRPTRITGTHTDITARKLADHEAEQLQRRMQETQRLESLGVLAGGVAHDFNNLLTVILGNTSLMRLDQEAASSARLDKITQAAHRAAELCRQLLAYSGQGAFTLERLSLNGVLRDSLHLFHLSTKRAAEVESDLAADLPPVEADPLQLQQLIMNLVLNAAEALPDRGGFIRIGTRPVTLARGALVGALPSSDIPGGNYVCLSIADNGTGMTEEVRQKVFDPFFTTKSIGRGLGLAAVLGIVRSLHGALVLHSEAGSGTTFLIYLPAHPADTPSAPPTVTRPPAAPGPRNGVILVVADDEALCPLYLELLAQLGYTPALTTSGAAAARITAAEMQRYSAALLDLSFPGKTGEETLHLLRQHRPDLPCVLITDLPAPDSPPPAGFSARLQKPFSPDGLIAVLRRVMRTD